MPTANRCVATRWVKFYVTRQNEKADHKGLLFLLRIIDELLLLSKNL